MSSAAERRTSIAADCTQSTRRTASPVLCTTKRLCSHSADSSAVAGGREAPRRGLLRAVGLHEHRAGRAGLLVAVQRGVQGDDAAELELGVLVEQQAEAALRPLQEQAVVRRLALALGQRDHFRRHRVAAGGLHRAVLRGVVEHQDLGLEVQRGAFARDRVQAVAQQSTLLGVDHAERELDGHEGCSLAHAARGHPRAGYLTPHQGVPWTLQWERRSTSPRSRTPRPRPPSRPVLDRSSSAQPATASAAPGEHNVGPRVKKLVLAAAGQGIGRHESRDPRRPARLCGEPACARVRASITTCHASDA